MPPAALPAIKPYANDSGTHRAIDSPPFNDMIVRITLCQCINYANMPGCIIKEGSDATLPCCRVVRMFNIRVPDDP